MKNKVPPRVLITVPNACKNDNDDTYCDKYALAIAKNVAKDLQKEGFLVALLYSDATQGIIDANSKESSITKLPPGIEIKNRAAKLRKEGIDISNADAINDVANAVSFRDEFTKFVKNEDMKPIVHLDFHTFSGCRNGIRVNKCYQVAIPNVLFYGKDDKIGSELAKSIRNLTQFTSGQVPGSRGNHVLLSGKVENSTIVEFNKDFVLNNSPTKVSRELSPAISRAIIKTTKKKPIPAYASELEQRLKILKQLKGIESGSGGKERENVKREIEGIELWVSKVIKSQ